MASTGIHARRARDSDTRSASTTLGTTFLCIDRSWPGASNEAPFSPLCSIRIGRRGATVCTFVASSSRSDAALSTAALATRMSSVDAVVPAVYSFASSFAKSRKCSPFSGCKRTLRRAFSRLPLCPSTTSSGTEPSPREVASSQTTPTASTAAMEVWTIPSITPGAVVPSKLSCSSILDVSSIQSPSSLSTPPTIISLATDAQPAESRSPAFSERWTISSAWAPALKEPLKCL
mmetsp:Transcript_17392/g.41208  ORF Transcript_17392/g.41208 Transcript_17392/m.41208 type:complete len:233 (-) Transcript_17392:3343-4041(-)